MLHRQMNPDRWQRIEALFHSVADDDPGPERDHKLRTLAAGDEALAAEVTALLASDDDLAAPNLAPDRRVGLRLGSYEVSGLIARGGMASVYEAHRADDQFRQQVAIKVMDVRLSDDRLVTAFLAERQILATLEHGAITRLIDGGVTEFGEPYLVMEHVNGVPIDQYCNAHALDVHARVRLFARACTGVDFAHRNLILHRDLKPSNILVTSDGQPKVVDFGTAALLQPERLTTISRAPLTPAYASPEQLTGRPVGTATDQYSLGLVLYELLTGTPAQPHGTSLITAVERALAGVEPARKLEGDLGTIVHKALASDPAARYASVEHLIEDLYRWLRVEPIQGRPQSWRYRASRFVSRHRVAVATAGLLLVALVVAAGVSVYQGRIARQESDRAQEINRFLARMLSSGNPSWTNPNAATAAAVTMGQFLDGAATLLADSRLSPLVEADIRFVLGRT
jgi:serine/threonine protein kinase